MKKRVLIVDDDAAVQASLQRVLTQAGYEVVVAGDGEEGIDLFAAKPIDLLVLDINLPIRSGWDVYEELTRADPYVPIIVITGLANQCELALAAGAGALIEKPVEVPALLEAMRKLLAEPKEDRVRRLCGQISDTSYVPSPITLFLQRLRERERAPYRCTLPWSTARQ